LISLNSMLPGRKSLKVQTFTYINSQPQGSYALDETTISFI